jgi:ferredoxin--NADP+ reductase
VSDSLLSTEEIEKLRRERYNAVLVAVTRVHEDLALFRVRADEPVGARVPGQFTTLGLGYWEPRATGCGEEKMPDGATTKIVRRSYSLSHSIVDSTGELLRPDVEELEFYVSLVRAKPDGSGASLTPRLFRLAAGDRLELGKRIVGAYTLSGVQRDENVVFLGTGTGEAPHNYMAWELLRHGHRGQVRIVTSVRYRKDLAYEPNHRAAEKKFPAYRYLGLATRDGGTPKRYLQDMVVDRALDDALGFPLDPATTHVFLCGNPAMIGAPKRNATTGQKEFPPALGAVKALVDRGFTLDDAATKTRGRIHYEAYW